MAFDFQYSVRRAVAGLGAAFLAAVLATLALTAVLYAMQWLPRAGILAHIRSSFTNGALQEQDWLVHNDRLGLNQYSDCMLIQMFFFRREAWADTVAPIVVFNDWPVPLWADDGEQLSECAIARTAAFSEAPFALYPAQSYFPYGRYMHAYRLPAYLLLEQFDVGAIRRLYRMMAFGMLVMILVTQLLVMLWRAERAEDRSRAGPHVLQGSFFVILSLIFIHFYALELYALSLVQAPSDILIFGAIAVLSLLRPVWPLRRVDLCIRVSVWRAAVGARGVDRLQRHEGRSALIRRADSNGGLPRGRFFCGWCGRGPTRQTGDFGRHLWPAGAHRLLCAAELSHDRRRVLTLGPLETSRGEPGCHFLRRLSLQ